MRKTYKALSQSGKQESVKTHASYQQAKRLREKQHLLICSGG